MRILFFINPIAGGHDNGRLMGKLLASATPDHIVETIMWKDASDLDKLDAALATQPDRVIAVGGDGTVNEVAQRAAAHQVPMGIVAAGSGNGLARAMRLPMNTDAAIATAWGGTVSHIDHGVAGGQPFYCTAGFGFDAVVAHRFAASERGLINYARITVQELFAYKAGTVSGTADGVAFEVQECLFATVANASQFGNNVSIAPDALLDDGMLNLVLLRQPKPWRVPVVAAALAAGRIHEVAECTTFAFKTCHLNLVGPGPSHFDGEPATHMGQVDVTVGARPLRVIVSSEAK